MSRRFDQEARKIADRHYSRQKVGTPDFVGNGKPLVLLAPHDGPATALWVTLWQPYVRHAWTDCWQCTLFRNEGAGLSSELITEAVAATCAIWGDPPKNGFLTFIDQDKTKPKRHPGYCYRMAGWIEDGKTKNGLIALRLPVGAFPGPVMPYGGQLSMMPEPGGWSNARSKNTHANVEVDP